MLLVGFGTCCNLSSYERWLIGWLRVDIAITRVAAAWSFGAVGRLLMQEKLVVGEVDPQGMTEQQCWGTGPDCLLRCTGMGECLDGRTVMVSTDFQRKGW